MDYHEGREAMEPVPVSSPRYKDLPTPMDVHDIESLRLVDPTVYDAVQTVMATLKNDMLPADVQFAIVEAMNPGTRREIVFRMAGLNSSVLMSFKQQLELVGNVLRRTVNPDGTAPSSGNDMGMSVKDAMTMSLRVMSVLSKDLPKVYNIARIQRLEKALLEVVETMPKHLQDQVLVALEKAELKAAKENNQ